MRKLSLAILGAATITSGVNAMEFCPSFYIGAEGNITKLSENVSSTDEYMNFLFTGNPDKQARLLKKSLYGFSPYIGVRLDLIGIELGHTFYESKNVNYYNNWLMGNYKTKNDYVDFVGYIPVYDNVEIIGSIGAGKVKQKFRLKSNQVNYVFYDDDYKITDASGKYAFIPLERANKFNSNMKDKSRVGIRFGVGMQYTFTESITGRVMLKTQRVGGNHDMLNDFYTINLGLHYTFM